MPGGPYHVLLLRMQKYRSPPPTAKSRSVPVPGRLNMRYVLLVIFVTLLSNLTQAEMENGAFAP